MATTRTPFLYRTFAGIVQIIQSWRHEVVNEMVTVDAGGTLIIQADATLVVLN